ncbi:hypothetical protein GCM10010121_084800 [Streptomyces brasiliensis]|uniref:Uncharacterized protein n=1 Tax=Streptomyces brasiliensis TaxID=1954 RepID=A0A917P4H2_9ACTN|nr:hypothetical protein GCM10010121_084800 [Streptomyces brasiliensis]
MERWRRLDLLVNNAGIAAPMPLAETDRRLITHLFELHVTAPSPLSHAALPHLRPASGSIVNVSSTYPASPGRRNAPRRGRERPGPRGSSGEHHRTLLRHRAYIAALTNEAPET